jgi:hypothetical protein
MPVRSRSAPGKVKRDYRHNPNWESRELHLVKTIEHEYILRAKRVLRKMDNYIERNRADYRGSNSKNQRPAITAIISGDFKSVIPELRPDRTPIFRRAAPCKKLVQRLTSPKYGSEKDTTRDAPRKHQRVLIKIMKRCRN